MLSHTAKRKGIPTADVSFGQFHVKWSLVPWSVGLLGGRGGIYLIQRFGATSPVQIIAEPFSVALV